MSENVSSVPSLTKDVTPSYTAKATDLGGWLGGGLQLSPQTLIYKNNREVEDAHGQDE